jgi:hypothetical protein
MMLGLRCWIVAAAAVGAFYSEVLASSPFATSVVEYAPAPGHLVNDADFDDPTEALGPPSGGGTYEPDNSSVVTLGGFGGSITLEFDHIVEDDVLNPLGMDAIVFGNAFWVGNDPERHWAECATIEIALDTNGNGQIDEDEGWYLIPGSHVTDPAVQYATQTWDDDIGDTTYPPALASWIPPGCFGIWNTEGYLLPEELFSPWIVENPSVIEDVEGIYGYAEYAPTIILGDMDGDNVIDEPSITAEEFYTVPDDPLTVGINPGSGGGDAFDIAWAIDVGTGLAADLPGFDFIRLTNAVNRQVAPFGEKSPEIDAVADVAPDPFGDCDHDGDIDLADAACLQNCFQQSVTTDDPCGSMDRNADEIVDATDAAAFMARLTGPK